MNPRTVLNLVSIAAGHADPHPRGLGYLGNIAPLDKYVQAGTTVQWVGRLYGTDTNGTVSKITSSEAATVAYDLNAMLYTGGWFSDVRVDYNGFWNIDFVVQVTAGTDFARLSDVVSVIEGTAWNLSYDSNGVSFAHFAPQMAELNILSVPSGNSAASVQPTPSPTGGGNAGGQNNVQNNQNVQAQCIGQYQSSFCGCGKAWGWFPPGCYPVDVNGKFIGDKGAVDSLAEWLGVTPTQAVVVGALGAVLAVVAVKRVL